MVKVETNIRNSKQAWTRQLSVFPWTPVKQDLPDTRRAVIKYLEALPWTFFLTGSTRYELTLKSTRRLMERWFDEFKTPGSMLFWVAEKFECKDGFHGHGLLYMPAGPEGPDRTLFNRLIDAWQWATGNKTILVTSWYKEGGRSKMEWDKTKWNALNLKHYDKKRGAGGYCAKYVFKDDADYDLLIP